MSCFYDRFLEVPIRRSDYGLLLGSEALGSEAILGFQNHKQNKWPISMYGIGGAWINTIEPSIISKSIFLIDASQSGFYPPNISELAGLDWFQTEIKNEYVFDCSSPGLVECCENFNIPDTIIDFDVNPEIKNFHLKRQLFQSVLFGILDTLGNYPLNNFCQKSDTTDYGKLTKARWNFINSVIVPPNQRDDYISEALAQNASITGSSDFLILETTSNEVLADYLSEGNLVTFISADEDILEIAELCPYEFGAAVYMNRSWLKAIDLEIEFDEIPNCGQIEPRSYNPKSKEFQSLTIYPNPVKINQLFTIELGKSGQNIMISDIYGKIIYIAFGIVNEHKITMQLNTSGLYFIYIVDQNYETQIGKLTVFGN
jgi:hypothetical protein